jgi:hypothetical protein
VRRELAEPIRGERRGQLVDPFGHRWNVVAASIRSASFAGASPTDRAALDAHV